VIETKTKTIDDVEYTFRPLMAKSARNMLIQLTNKIGPSVGEGIEGLKSVGDIDGLNLESNITEALPSLAGGIGGIVKGLTTTLQPAFYENLIETFLSKVQMKITDENGQDRQVILKSDIRETLFATSLSTELKVLIWCLEVQYGDFTLLLRKGIASVGRITAGMMKQSSNSPAASTGSSTE
jgi:hypothetical protein